MMLQNKYFFVFTTALVVGTLSILHVIVALARTPADSVYLFTGHYYLDYFPYLQGIVQGMRGRWLFENPYSTEDTGSTVIVWGLYVMLGRVASLFGLSAVATYVISVFLFSFTTVILVFLVVERVLVNRPLYMQYSAFLLAIFAAPFAKIIKTAQGIQLIPYDLWYVPSVFFKRFPYIPHHLIGNAVLLTVLLVVARLFNRIGGLSLSRIGLYGVFIALLIIVTLTFYPWAAAVMVVAILMSGVVLGIQAVLNEQAKSRLRGLFVFAVVFLALVVPGALFVRGAAGSFGMIGRLGSTDVTYSSFPSWHLFLLSLGPVVVMAPIGIFKYFRHSQLEGWLLFYFTSVSLILSFSKIAQYVGSFNLRFMSPLIYILFGILAVLGMQTVAQLVNKNARQVTLVITIAFLFLTVPVGGMFFYQMTRDENLVTPISYLPRGLIEGYAFLDGVHRGIVLTAPNQFLGTVLPIFADQRVYIARPQVTADYVRKNIEADAFYRGALDDALAGEFVADNSIEYVFLASIENYDPDNLAKYSFLKEIYRNEASVIYQVEKKNLKKKALVP